VTKSIRESGSSTSSKNDDETDVCLGLFLLFLSLSPFFSPFRIPTARLLVRGFNLISRQVPAGNTPLTCAICPRPELISARATSAYPRPEAGGRARRDFYPLNYRR
jgi:hypothetical protein